MFQVTKFNSTLKTAFDIANISKQILERIAGLSVFSLTHLKTYLRYFTIFFSLQLNYTVVLTSRLINTVHVQGKINLKDTKEFVNSADSDKKPVA